MNQDEYEQSLVKAHDYFIHDQYDLFLDEFSRCYQFNTDCFTDNLNVFKFSLATYSQNNNRTINEYNRFKLHFDEYIGSLKDKKEKEAFIVKVKTLIDKKYDAVSLYNQIINYDSFNNYCVILMQLYEFTEKCVNENLFYDSEIINDFLTDIDNKIKQLMKIISWTGSRYKVRFIYLPKKPKEFLKDLEKSVDSLRQKSLVE